MLRVPTYVAPSRISGVGLFAAVDIPARTIVWAFDDGVDWRLTAEELERFPEPYRSRMRHYVYREESGLYVLCGDNAKFMNHADRPNCDDSGPTYTVTKRRVRAGDEVTCDYRTFDFDARATGVGFGAEQAARAVG